MFVTGKRYRLEEEPEVFQTRSFRVFSVSLPPGIDIWQYVHGVLPTQETYQSLGIQIFIESSL